MESEDTKVVVFAVLTGALAITMWWVIKSMSCGNKSVEVTLDKVSKVPLTLTEKEVISHDTRRFRFSLPSESHTLGLPVGNFIMVSVTLDGKLTIRPYTPITGNDELGYMDLMIKVYSAGKVSSYIDSLAIGDQIMIRGPVGKIRYHGKGAFEVEKSKGKTITVNAANIGMVAGGSGITPMLQVIRDVLKHEDDHTKMQLLFSNKTFDDILCRDMIESIKGPQFSVCHTLSQAPIPQGWSGESGRVNKAMLEKHLPAPAVDAVILLCGPPGLVKETCLPALLEIGHKEQNILVF